MAKTKPVEWDLDLAQAHRVLDALTMARLAAMKLGDQYSKRMNNTTPTGLSYKQKVNTQMSKIMGYNDDIRELQAALDAQQDPICGLPKDRVPV